MPNLANEVKPASKKSDQAAIRYCSLPIQHPRQFDPSGTRCADALSTNTKVYHNGLKDGLSEASGTDLKPASTCV